MKKHDLKQIETRIICGVSLEELCRCFPKYDRNELEAVYNRIKSMDIPYKVPVRKKRKTEMIPWWSQMWFISLVLWGGIFSGYFILEGFFVAGILFTIRLVKYPKAERAATLSFGIQIGLFVLICMILLIGAFAWG